MLYKSLNQIEEKLPDGSFFRVNRQQIINTNFISNVVPWFNGKLKLTMRNGEEVEVSRRQSYLFKDRMSF
jgi:two-component system LytT family response regulator